MKVRLHIERIVLDGLDVPYGARAALRAAMERELARRIAAAGLAPALSAGTAVPSVAAPPIEAAGPPTRLGAAIAAAVYGGIGGGERP
jgi:hypothetical protein